MEDGTMANGSTITNNYRYVLLRMQYTAILDADVFSNFYRADVRPHNCIVPNIGTMANLNIPDNLCAWRNEVLTFEDWFFVFEFINHFPTSYFPRQSISVI
jgi:hypothetical protein